MGISTTNTLERTMASYGRLNGLNPTFGDHNRAYYKKLQKAGVKVNYKELQGVLHVAQGPLMGDYIDKLNAEIKKEIGH